LLGVMGIFLIWELHNHYLTTDQLNRATDMNTRTLIMVLILMAMALEACGPGDAGQTGGASLEGTQWVLLALNGQPPLAGTTPTAEFSESEISGSAGCNHYFGSYEAAGSDLTISEVGMTEMYCMEPAGVMEQEQAFLSVLASVTSYRLAADRLEMLDSAGNVVLAFALPVPMPEVTLEGTEWALTTFIEGETAVSLISGAAITVRFEDGKVWGSAGCNDYGGPYTLERGTLGLAGFDITGQRCSEPVGIMEQEAKYIDVLGSVTIFEIDANQLTLSTADGRGLVFTATPETGAPAHLMQAREALQTFFSLLHDQRYSEAVQYYGGDYETLREWNPTVLGDDHAKLFQNGCSQNGLQCLVIKTVLQEEEISTGQYLFTVEFAQDDGSLFTRGPCCGVTETEMPPVSQFAYTVRKVNGQFLVQELPVYVP
jgi:heat shock protein HslJ